MTSPLHRALECPFCMSKLLHFCQSLSNPSVDLELELIFRKLVKRRFQRCIVLTEILSTLHTRDEYISVTKYTIEIIGPMKGNDPKIHLFRLRHMDRHLIHECLGDPNNSAKQQLDQFTHFRTTMEQRPNWLHRDAPNSSQKLPLSLQR